MQVYRFLSIRNHSQCESINSVHVSCRADMDPPGNFFVRCLFDCGISKNPPGSGIN